MKQIHKVATALLLLLIFGLMPVLANSASFTWTWKTDDSRITTYRYQLDNEIDSEWVVVDATTNNCVISGLDLNTEYTLYVQQSIDGKNWSKSGSSTFYPKLKTPIIEESPIVEVDEIEILPPV